MQDGHYRRRNAWWGYVKTIIRSYNKRKNLELNGNERRETEAVRNAIAKTETMLNGTYRIALVELVFWKQTHTIQGAAMVLHLSERTAQRYHSDFIKEVARQFGLIDE